MKNTFLCLLIFMFSQTIFAQKIFTFQEREKDKTLFFLLKDYERKKDTIVVKPIINDRVFSHKITLQLLDFFKQNGINPEEYPKKFTVFCELYMQPKGAIEYCIFEQDFATNLDSTKRESMRELLVKFCQNNVLKNDYQRNKKIMCIIDFGGKEKRQLRHNELVELEISSKTTRPDTVYKINLSNLELTEVPTSLKQFYNVRELDLSNNYIKTLPEWISDFKDLKNIHLNKNDLSETAVYFKKNTSIKTINLQYNSLTKIPKTIRNNKNLDVLLLGNNPIKKLNNQAFKGLKKLTSINLYNLGLKELPNGIRKLKNLQELDLYYNNLVSLPKKILKLKKLTTLAVAFNNLNLLPKNLYYLKNLQKLFTHHNRLIYLPKLPETIMLLDIGHNYFNKLPETVFELPNLAELDFSYNELTNYPQKIEEIKSLKTIFWRNNPFLKTIEVEKIITKFSKNGVEIH